MKYSTLLIFFGYFPLIFSRQQCDSSFPDGGSCDSSSNGVTKADPESCEHYYQCVDICVQHMSCDMGMAYDEMYFMCRSSSEVDCGSRPCTDPAHCNPQTTTEKHLDCTPADQKMNCTNTGTGFFPDPFNCRRYWECTVNHQAIHYLCEDADDGTPMMFDLVYDGCNYDFLTQCGSRPKCDECNDNCDNPMTTQPDCGHDMDCSDKDDGYYPDPYSCERFWQCERGTAFHSKCQPGLFYDPINVMCDWPENVDCGSRPPCDECLDEC